MEKAFLNFAPLTTGQIAVVVGLILVFILCDSSQKLKVWMLSLLCGICTAMFYSFLVKWSIVYSLIGAIVSTVVVQLLSCMLRRTVSMNEKDSDDSDEGNIKSDPLFSVPNRRTGRLVEEREKGPSEAA